MEMQLAVDKSSPAIVSLFDRAKEQLPAHLEGETNSAKAAAWVAQRMLAMAESDRKNMQTVQALLATWIVNGELGELWMEHEANYPTFRDFLRDVGTEQEGNTLSAPVISDLVSIAERIVPYCRTHGVETDSYFAASLWSRLRAVIPALNKAIESNDITDVRRILGDVEALPSSTLRLMYHGRNRDRSVMADMISRNGTSVIVVVLPTDDTAAVRQLLSRKVEWGTIAAGTIDADGAARLTVSTIL